MNEAHRKHLFPYSLIHFKKAAFTLAEVLITLGIIGVVAAMTIPTLIANYQEKQIVSQLSKAFQTLSNAYQMMQIEYGPVSTWSLRNTQVVDDDGNITYDRYSQNLVAERLKKYLRVEKECEVGKICDNRTEYNLAGTKISDPAPLEADGEPGFWLADGTFVNVGWYADYTKTVDIAVILPGAKNILGKTRFFFWMTDKGIIPEGLPDVSYGTNTFDLSCRTDGSVTDRGKGRACAAWVIHNKNLDYLHCREELSWDGKHSCD